MNREKYDAIPEEQAIDSVIRVAQGRIRDMREPEGWRYTLIRGVEAIKKLQARKNELEKLLDKEGTPLSGSGCMGCRQRDLWLLDAQGKVQKLTDGLTAAIHGLSETRRNLHGVSVLPETVEIAE